jgi:hypothetical protein
MSVHRGAASRRPIGAIEGHNLAGSNRHLPRGQRYGSFLLFVTLWLFYGVLIQSDNLHEFNLQQMGIEAIVERTHFFVDGSSTPELQPRGDVFEHRGHLYAVKQPGQFLIGSLVYLGLYHLGLRYAHHFTLTAALVTFLTASLMTAITAVVLFRLARALSAPAASLHWPLAVALIFALTSTALPYAGIAHHDAIAAGYLAAAFYFAFRLGRTFRRETEPRLAAASGFLLGLTITTSLLPLFMAALVALYAASFRRRPGFLLAGLVAGLLPLLLYNAASFGNPFVVAYVARGLVETRVSLDRANAVARAVFYAAFVTAYVPLFWVGLLGYLLFPGSRRREQLTCLGAMTALGGYLLNIGSLGHCQYGPRYLLPAMPFAALGILGYRGLERRGTRRAAMVLMWVVGLASLAINLIGALGGAMYCDIEAYAVPRYLAALWEGHWPNFPLARLLAIPFLVSLATLLRWVHRQSRQSLAARSG